MMAGSFYYQSSGIKAKILQLAINRIDLYTATGNMKLRPV